jgi:hypothetical protein
MSEQKIPFWQRKSLAEMTDFLKVVWGVFASKSICDGEAHWRVGRAGHALAMTLLTV